MFGGYVRPPADGIDWPATITVILSVAFFVAALVGIVAAVVLLLRWSERQAKAGKVQHETDQARRNAEIEAQWAAQRRGEEMQRDEARRIQEEALRLRREDLVQRFGEVDAVRIMAHDIWVGQSRVMLVESLGPPIEQDEKVMKTRTRHVLKWQRMGVGRFALRVTLDDGIVTGWER